MATPIIKTSFAAGEMSASLAGRVDLAKYQVGAAVMRNFFVDFRGGASTRPGTAHVGRLRRVANNPKGRLVPFVFSNEQAYVLELNNNRMRVIYRGGYITKTPFAITAAANANPLTITVPGHDFAVGDFVYVTGVVGLLRPNGVSGINGRTLYASAVVGNVITLADKTGATYSNIDASAWSARISGGTAAKVFEIATPWASSALFDLKYVQSADVMTVTCLDYSTYDIRRIAADDWQITQETYGASLPAPTSFGAYPQNTGSAATQVYFFVYAVTAVDADGRESVVALASCENKALDQTMTPTRTNNLEWAAVPGSYKYRVYKAQPVPTGMQGGGPYYFGLIGNVFANRFIDVNYAPDFTVGPPVARNPFLDQGIASASITAAGTGYVKPYAVITDSSGTGATLALASDTSPTAAPYGALSVANVVANGTGYSAPTVAVFDAAPAGSGLVLAFSGAWIANPLGTGFVPAPGSITISNPGNNYHFKTANNFIRARAGSPVGANYLYIDISLVAYGQVQTISWAPTDIAPTNTTGLSSTGASDTLTFEIVGADAVPAGATVTVALGGDTNPNTCAYLEQRRVFGGSRANPSTLWASQPGQFTNFNITDPVQDDNAITASLNAQEVNIIEAMVAATGGLVVLTSGGAYLVTGGSNGITPGTIQANPQAFTGIQKNLQPIRAGNQLLYAQSRGSAVAELAYNFYTSQFTSMDVSVLSGHLFQQRYITQWAYAAEPFKLVWCVRDDGILLCLTYLKEQEVYGWSRHDTQGEYISVVTIPEGREDAVYFIVNRYIPGQGYEQHVERMASRDFGADPAANVPAVAEDAWCVDDGAAYPLTTYSVDIERGYPVSLGAITAATVVTGGSGYVAPVVQILDLTGSGAVITLAYSGGVITGATIVNGGSGYTNPEITIIDAGGVGGGAVISAKVSNLMNFEAPGAGFTTAFLGYVFRALGGLGTVVAVPNGDTIQCDMQRLPIGLPNYPEYITPRVRAGTWSMTNPVSVIGGLDHLNGCTVQLLVDGSVQSPRVVADGCVTLDVAGTSIKAGLGYTAQLQTMRLEPGGETMQGRRKTIPTLVLRSKDSRGLMAGANWNALTEVKQREYENYGTPIVFQKGGQRMASQYDGAPCAYVPLRYDDTLTHLQSDYQEEGVVCIQQSWPLPSTVLAVVPFLNAGDTVK